LSEQSDSKQATPIFSTKVKAFFDVSKGAFGFSSQAKLAFVKARKFKGDKSEANWLSSLRNHSI
jgi:hypothetical protein